MPVARVQMPDGRIARVEVPEGTSPEQARSIALRAIPKEAPRQKGTGIGWLDDTISVVNETALGAVQGLYNAGAFLTDPIVSAVYGDDVLKADRKRRQDNFEGLSRQVSTKKAPISRTIGQIAGTLPLMNGQVMTGAGKVAPIVNRAVQGAIGGAAVRDSDTNAAQPATIGALANVALPPVLSRIAATKPVQAVAQRAGNALAPIVNAADDLADDVRGFVQPRLGMGEYQAPVRIALGDGASFTDDALGMFADDIADDISPADDAAEQLQMALAPLGDDAVARAERFQRVGVQNPTTGMVTRDPRAWQYERTQAALSGHGDDMLAQIKGVEADLATAGQGMAAQAPGREVAGRQVQDALAAKRDEMQVVIGGLYKQARDQFGDVGVPSLDGLWTRMADPSFRNNPTFGQMNSSVTGLLRDFGVVDDAGANIPGAQLSLTQAEELRKFINRLGNSTDPTVIAGRKTLVDALDDDVLAVGGNPFIEARDAARQRFAEFSKTYAGKLADSKVPPERVVANLQQAGTRNQDVRDLRRSLLTGTKDQRRRGYDALTDLRRQTIGDLINPTISPDGGVNGGMIYRNVNNNRDRLDTLLTPGQMKAMDDYAVAARDATAQVPNSFVNNSNTGATIANLFGNMTPPGNQGGMFSRLVRHGAAYSAGGPAANVGLIIADDIARTGAERAAAEQGARQFAAASDPTVAARTIGEMARESMAEKAQRELFERWQNFLGGSGALGGAVASPYSQ